MKTRKDRTIEMSILRDASLDRKPSNTLERNYAIVTATSTNGKVLDSSQ